MHPRAVFRFTPEQYLTFEVASVEKHEFFDGYILAMAGGNARHSATCMRVGAALMAATRGRPCVTLSSDMRVLVEATGLYTYPDLSVACPPQVTGRKEASTLVNPTLLVEVLSKDTAKYDRGEKLEHYQRVPSVHGVLLVDIPSRTVEVVARVDGTWSRVTYGVADAFTLPGLEASVAVADFFDGIDLVPDEPAAPEA